MSSTDRSHEDPRTAKGRDLNALGYPLYLERREGETDAEFRPRVINANGLAIANAHGREGPFRAKPWDQDPSMFTAPPMTAEQLATHQGIAAAAMAHSTENARAMSDATVALLISGVAVDVSDIEIIHEAGGTPGQWRVRVRRKVCDCGRAV